jgi:hypothetical protein
LKPKELIPETAHWRINVGVGACVILRRPGVVKEQSLRTIVPEWEEGKQEVYLIWDQDFGTRFAESKFPQALHWSRIVQPTEDPKQRKLVWGTRC